MKAATRRNTEARKNQEAASERLLTWCMGTCNQPTEHSTVRVSHGWAMVWERVCTVCGHNKDAGK